jgi:pre-rRNA-processing protein TSR4
MAAEINENEAVTGLENNPSIQLGFCVPIEGDQHLEEVAHRSPDYRVWDGGQVGGKPVWLDPEHLPTRVTCRQCAFNGASTERQKDSQKQKTTLPPLMRFICQLYAPGDDSDRAFHRSLYVFACPICCSSKNNGGIRVLRAQLPLQAPYFPNFEDGATVEEEVNWTQHLPSEWNQNLCAVCGLAGKGKCPLQHKYFCGPQHQREHKIHIHDKLNKQPNIAMEDVDLPSVYHMTQLVVEEEPGLSEEHASPTDSNGLFAKDDDDGDDDDADLEQDDLNEMTGVRAESVIQDPVTTEFYQRIQDRSNARHQCLRYCRWPIETIDGAPLWIQQEGRPDDSDIPDCPYCGGPRRFEFQLMPQMLHYLLQKKKHLSLNKNDDNNKATSDGRGEYSKLKEALEQTDSLVQQAPPEQIPPALIEARDAAIKRVQDDLLRDRGGDGSASSRGEVNWGVVAVYTCTQSCSAMKNGGGDDVATTSEEMDPDLGAYREEFAWVQPSLDL